MQCICLWDAKIVPRNSHHYSRLFCKHLALLPLAYSHPAQRLSQEQTLRKPKEAAPRYKQSFKSKCMAFPKTCINMHHLHVPVTSCTDIPDRSRATNGLCAYCRAIYLFPARGTEGYTARMRPTYGRCAFLNLVHLENQLAASNASS